ncbi:MAG: LysR family transcriptional regulator [Rhodospirillaceae bacterium]|jgi:DNA-binding transcriptional LysR family regulator|nr:LysR family transcriptional regulator [Rhodospirillaceae bacterium]MBT5241038.1 LysR family transcriptional regulator [Rhodospirillaceae bacterium]MBT5564654.1 LysR family transcriptional regulator [Rhodospirillaceae bacterium]MBT6090989.1 LysR family transcriptional regulator [Rhodospirillaceae bacterium]MBT6961376.1 LysR family transcriptional regulator [Rhodospirillaceae bacterium]
MNDLNDLLIFAKVAELLGISSAARALRLPKSKVSRRLAALEDELGVRLLERNTRGARLTDAGEIYYQHCKRIVEEAAAARESVSQMMAAPRGPLKISASVAIGQHLLTPVLGAFMALYPEIELDIQLENRRVDLIREGYDAVIRIGTLDDSSLISKPLGEDYAILVASQIYLKENGIPKTLSDLKSHRLLVMGDAPILDQWVLVGPDEQQESVAVRPYATLNDLTMIRQVAIDGGGIALLPRYLCTDAVMQSDGLRQVLGDWRSLPFGFYALYPSRRSMTLKLRALLDFLADKLGPQN